MRFVTGWIMSLGIGFGITAPLDALDESRAAIGADVSQLLLGDGTGVTVGIIDSGVDDTHPGLTGLDSLGQPRFVAEANFVTTEPGNMGDDVHGHGTAVAGVILGTEIPAGSVTIQGVAPDARFINARVLDSNNGFSTGSWVLNGVGFAVEQGADVLNLSLNFFAPNSDGNSSLDLMLDWATGEGVHVAACAGNIGQGTGTSAVRGPGSLYNGFSVGRTGNDFASVHPDSANAFTEDGRMKPDVVAPGTNIRTFNDDWETGADFTFSSGCSFATPHTAGLLAQQIDFGRTQGLATHPLVTKATMMNTAARVLDKGLQPWEVASSAQVGGVTRMDGPLDTHSGAGQINGVALHNQYAAGEQAPGAVARTGWDL
ncbi:MAG: S8 family serine peptidase, partial [Planctomycetota bacterium]